MALIPITGVPSSYKVPGALAEILFAQGPASASTGVRRVAMVMPKSTAGTWAVNVAHRVRSEQEAKVGVGPGSPAHRAARIFLKANKTAKLYVVPYAETTGTPASATGVITITFGSGSNPTATGVWTGVMQGVLVSASYTTADTATTIGDKIVAAINAQEHLAFTASNSSGTVTLTAKIAGKSQGDGTTGVLRYRSSVTPGTNVVSTDQAAALSLGAGTDGAEGSTTEATNLNAALTAIASARFYYVGTSTWHATELGHCKTQIATKSEPRAGLRSVFVAGYTGALAAVQTLATTLNYERGSIVWQPNSEHDPAEMVGAVLAIRQKYEELDPTHNFDTYSGADWQLLPAASEADWPDTDDQNDAINDGITPIASNDSGAYLVFSATTRSKNAGGTVDDPRALETHRISGADFVVDSILTWYALNFQNKKLRSDQLLADGSVNTNQTLARRVVTPHNFRGGLAGELDQFEDNGILQNVEETKQSLVVVRDPNNGGRLEAGVDLHVIDLLHQTTFRFAEVSSG